MIKLHRSISYVLCGVSLWLLLIASATAQGGNNPARATLYDRLGGLAPISVVVSDFIDIVIADPELNKNPAVAATRATVPAAYLKYRVTALVCSATGGECQYQGKTMQQAHNHLSITDAEWERMLVLFKQVLVKHKVTAPETRELLAIIGSTKTAIVDNGAKL